MKAMQLHIHRMALVCAFPMAYDIGLRPFLRRRSSFKPGAILALTTPSDALGGGGAATRIEPLEPTER